MTVISWEEVDLSTYFPAADSEEESQYIRLLLLLKLFDVFEGTHIDYFVEKTKVSKQTQKGLEGQLSRESVKWVRVWLEVKVNPDRNKREKTNEPGWGLRLVTMDGQVSLSFCWLAGDNKIGMRKTSGS